MPSIAINTQYVDLKPTTSKTLLSSGFVGDFSITSSLNEIRVGKNDKVIVVIPKGDKDLEFESEGVITGFNWTRIIPSTEISRKRRTQNLQAPEKEKFEHNFSIEIIKELKGNNLLSDLEYSLTAVYRFNKPIVHFQQQFRELSKHDYETIVSGWIYYSRTAFGKLVNAIPRQNKLEFMLQAMDHFSTVDFKEVRLYDGLDFLYNYISKRILSRGRLLVETNNLLKQHLSDIVPNEEIGFFNPSNFKSNNLSAQALLFEELFKMESQSDIRKLIQKSISEDSQLEQRFIQIFKQETWPIDLTL